MQNHTILQESYNAGLYLRLSRDDRNGNAESMSIENQKKMLVAHVNERGWNISEIYIDDGFSGTTFDRPAFQRMIEDIEQSKINMVITKDLSRLGRNYVMTGQYTDFFFPKHNVRFIALNDNIDSMEEDNDIAPFKNILNEMYAKDISKKVRSMRTMSAKEGKFMGSIPPYGYMRDPSDKHKLIVDEDTRDVVKDCFGRYAVGESMRQIAMDLTARGVLSPKSYYYSRIGGSNPKSNESPTWSSNAIRQMLHNQVYIGNMVQGMRVALSFKSKQRIFTSPEQWIVIENTHEAIIDPDIWEAVQKRLALKGTTRNRVSTENNQLSLFSGLVVCADCGSKLAFTTRHNKNSTVCLYRCVRYNLHGRDVCTSHRITEEYLSQIVLNDIRINAKLAEKDEEALKTQIRHLLHQQQGYAERSVQKEIDIAQSRLAALDALINKLMEDRCAGNISDSMFRKLISGYEKEQTELEANLTAFQACASATEQTKSDVSKWTKQIKNYTEITELDRNIVTTLIEKIMVSEKYNVDGKTYQDVQIQYKFVGSIQMAEEIPASQSA